MRRIIKLIIVVLIALVAYNYFLGTEKEKGEASSVLEELKDVGSAMKDMLAREKERFDQGKFNRIKEDITQWYNGIKKREGAPTESEITDLRTIEIDLENAIRNADEINQLEKQQIDSLLREVRVMLKDLENL